MDPLPTEQDDTYKVSVSALSASASASKITRTTLYLIVAFVVVAVISAALVVPKIISNNSQAKEIDDLQTQIDEQSKKLQNSSIGQ